MSGDSTFKTAMPDNVVYRSGYIRFIKSKMRAILNDSDVMAIRTKIQSVRPPVKAIDQDPH